MKNIILILFALYFNTSFAVPAFSGEQTFVQPDGSIFKGRLQGDEWLNWVEESNTKSILKYNKQSKSYNRAVVKEINGELDLVPSNIMFKISPNNFQNKSNYYQNKINSNTDNYQQNTNGFGQNTVRSLLGKIWRQKRDKAMRYQH